MWRINGTVLLLAGINIDLAFLTFTMKEETIVLPPLGSIIDVDISTLLSGKMDYQSGLASFLRFPVTKLSLTLGSSTAAFVHCGATSAIVCKERKKPRINNLLFIARVGN